MAQKKEKSNKIKFKQVWKSWETLEKFLFIVCILFFIFDLIAIYWNIINSGFADTKNLLADIAVFLITVYGAYQLVKMGRSRVKQGEITHNETK